MGQVKNSNKKYDAIDLCKLIGAFLVVSIHTQIFVSFSEEINYYFINIFSRLAVYFFFVASAYFFFKSIDFKDGKIIKSKENFQKLKKYFIRISLLYLIWSAIYFLLYAYQGYQEGWMSFAEVFFFGLNTLINTSYYHLWFLISLVYAIPLMYFMLRYVKVQALLVIASLLYAIGLLYGSYSFINLPYTDLWTLFGDKLPRLRTVIFDVIPICSFAIVCDKISVGKIKIGFIALILFLLYSAEGIFLYIYTPDTASSYNLLMIPTVVFIFEFVKSCNLKLKHSYIFRKLSTIIYCMHPLIMGLLVIFIDKSNINSLLYFGIVSLSVTVIGLGLIYLYKKFNAFKFLKYLM